ncbi:MAG: type phosphodiesterase/nucleotide pyrophosphatase [Deltaproteobacteria bacterium]|nr:type phosphodiesterase/nucleotide pyrophosphatase [Deltaproteobacteria bacterium]
MRLKATDGSLPGLTPPQRRQTAPTRQVVAAALTLLVLGAIAAVQAGSSGASFMRDLELANPALASIEPEIGDPHTARLTRRTFLVIIDGLGLGRSYQLPYLDELRRRGLDLEAQSHYPTYSRPNYVSMLTGVPPSASGVRTNFHDTPVTLDSLMDRAKAAGLMVAYASDSALIPSLFLRPSVASGPGHSESVAASDGSEEIEHPPFDIDAIVDPLSVEAPRGLDAKLSSPFDDARFAPWPGGFAEAGTALVAGHADLVVLLIGAVDAAGHGYGAESHEYREAAEISDHALARVLARVDLTQDTIIVLADHGHTDPGGHGGTEPEVLSVPLILAGAGIDVHGSAYDARLIDVAPTIAALLGIPAPGHGLGRTLTELLELDPDARARRLAADEVRLVRTRAVVATSEARGDAELLEDRAVRLALVAGGVVFATLLAWLLIRRRVLKLDLRVLLVSVPTFFVVYYTLIGTLGQRFSPSLVPASGHIATALIKYGIAGTVVQVAASLWALRHQGTLAQRLSAANGIAWTGLMLTMIPAGILWAYFPAPYGNLPGPLRLVLIPAVEVAVACAALNVALTLAAELIVFAAHATRRDRPTLD